MKFQPCMPQIGMASIGLALSVTAVFAEKQAMVVESGRIPLASACGSGQISVAERLLVGCPFPAAVVISMMCRRRTRALSCRSGIAGRSVSRDTTEPLPVIGWFPDSGSLQPSPEVRGSRMTPNGCRVANSARWSKARFYRSPKPLASSTASTRRVRGRDDASMSADGYAGRQVQRPVPDRSIPTPGEHDDATRVAGPLPR